LVKDFKPEGVLGGGTDSLTLAIFAHFNIGADFQNDFGREFHSAARATNIFGRAMKPDFVGVGALEGMRFDITTVAGAASHYGRPLYGGPGLTIITYERAATFTVFPK